MPAAGLSAFRAATRKYEVESLDLDRAQLELARKAVEESRLLLVGEPHGAHETPKVVYSLLEALDVRAVAFEWSHEEMDAPVQRFVRGDALDFDRLWSLPASADFFAGDGRITAGHFAMLQRLRDEGRLEQVILFDRIDPSPPPPDWRRRDREMAERLLEEWGGDRRLLVLTGGFHAQLAPDAGATMAFHVADAIPRLRPVTIEYASGRYWSRGLQDARESGFVAPITFRLDRATPAVVPAPGAHPPRARSDQ
jgi:hypothetical protein